ncbi:ABC transporter permease [Mycolicibacterium neoaurum]|uniref:ABC transporter permease n=1 Tax=Mycolicibacterium neoaurum TaxID=1795 RepID=UPI0026724F3F|nr:ABC transporter permease [Mycolicibacterium neoaurum]MDO3400461.1 ABC transporter permease [Mycolicibacterium neoaurum]
MTGALEAEARKLATTRSALWLTLSVAVLALGLAAMTKDPLLGVANFGVPVLMILSALTVTGEYRTAMIRTTFLATPRRTGVLAAKALVTAGFSAVVAAAMTAGSILIAGSGEWCSVGALALYAAAGAVLAVAVGALLRHTAAAVAVLLLVPFVVEPMLSVSTDIGDTVGPLLPFVNAAAFTGASIFGFLHSFSMWWGPQGSALYFGGVALGIFAAAVVVVERRDP